MRTLIAALITSLSIVAAAANKATLTVTSSAFKANEPIPSEYTCDGAETTPPLAWANVPANAKSIAILVDDPDAPKATFTHWIVTNIPPTATSLSAGGALPAGAVAAKNDKGATGYAAPCPPSGTHHYHFRVYALDVELALAAKQTKKQLLDATKGHILAQGELIGTYERK